MKTLLLAFILFTTTAHAEVSQDKYIHFSTVYAIQMVSYGVTANAFKMDKEDAVILSGFLTSIVWFTKEMLDAQNTRKLDLGDIGANVLGQGAAIGTLFVFDF